MLKAFVLLGLLTSSLFAVSAFSQTALSPAQAGADTRLPITRKPQAIPSCSARGTCITNPVFATGMKCDGVTDDSSALQSSLNAVQSAQGNATVIMPPGTCVIDPAAHITVGSGLWLQGAGRNGTTLKRKDSSAGGTLLVLAADGITLSDFGIDGNKGGAGITAAADSIAATAPSNQVTIQHVHFANATGSDIVSTTTGAGIYISNWLITENEFENQGLPACSTANSCANVLIRQPLGLRIIRNQSDASQHFALLSSVPGGGLVEVGNNTIVNVNGYAVSLDGGTPGSAGADIHHNFVSTTTADPDNLIYLSSWGDFDVDHNVLYHNGQFTVGGAPTSCIGGANAPHGIIDANACYAVPTFAVGVTGIAVAGSDTTISNNFIQGCSAAGIAFTVGSQGPVRGLKILGNTTKNNGNQAPGIHAGIELYLATGSGNLAGLSDVIIKNNHSYDDQTTKTQGYGIGIGLSGQLVNFSNILVEGNDVVGNINGGFRNNATIPGFVVRNNFGFNPVGSIVPPAFPGPSGGPITNDTGYDVTIYITAGNNPISIAINGAALVGVTIPAGAPGVPIRLVANQNITLTYTGGGTPSWQWVAD
jgi:pectate lyase-like protein/parallel beta helix pectate lyase-like protein